MDILDISVFQPAARNESPDARLNWLDMAAERASGSGACLLICPELSVTGIAPGGGLRDLAQKSGGEYAERVGEIAFLHQIALVFGYPESVNGNLYNSAVFVGHDGQTLASHRKGRLPGGGGEQGFSTSSGMTVFNYRGWKIALLIGQDIETPETARKVVLAGAELLIVPTALAAENQFVADKLVSVRAWENGVFLAFANWAGQDRLAPFLGGSRIVGPDGADEALAGRGEMILMAKLDKARIAMARKNRL